MLEERFDCFHTTCAGRHGCDYLSIDFVSHTNRYGVEIVENIQLGHNKAVEAVHFSGIAQQGHVEPTTSPGASRHGTELISRPANPLPELAPIFRWKGPSADTRDIGLRHTDDSVDSRRRNAGARAGAAGSRARAGDERVSAVIDIEHGALGAFKQHALPFPDHLVEQVCRVANQRLDLLRQSPVLSSDLAEIAMIADIERLRDQRLIFRKRIVEGVELNINQIGNANAPARDLVFITRTYAARGGANSNAVLARFRYL